MLPVQSEVIWCCLKKIISGNQLKAVKWKFTAFGENCHTVFPKSMQFTKKLITEFGFSSEIKFIFLKIINCASMTQFMKSTPFLEGFTTIEYMFFLLGFKRRAQGRERLS